MTQKINAVIGRPVTNIAHWDTVLASHPQVRHAWTPVRNQSYRNPADGLLRIPARKGGVAMAAYDDAVQWTDRGRFQVPIFPGGGGSTGRFRCEIPNPGNLISVMLNSHITLDGSEAWRLGWGDGSFFWYTPRRTANFRTLNNGSHHNFPDGAPLNQWNFDAVVIDLTNGVAAASTNGGEFTEVPGTDFAPKTDDTIEVRMGEGTPSQPFAAGSISDLAIIAGDVRTMPDLMAAWQHYNLTGYLNA